MVGENKGIQKNGRNGPINLFIVDEDSSILSTLADYFLLNDMKVKTASSVKEALKVCKKENFDVILSNLNMPEMDGLDLLKSLKGKNYTAEVIIFTGYGTVESGIEAMRLGAFNYVQKPMNMERLLVEVQKAAQKCRLRYENFLLKNSEVKKGPTFYKFISPRMQEVLAQLKAAAATDSAILLLGGSGVGKEVAANLIHNHSKRGRNAFIKVHCASLSPGVLESELFGHEKGSFTGAIVERKGRFELANGGTILLDEICTVPMESQIKLLRVLQEKQIERVGGNKTISVDFRLITASNENLREFVKKGIFRKDLYYRIGVIPINIPPLKEMKEDIPSLCRFFISKICNSIEKMDIEITKDAVEDLVNYSWPGNIRELRNVIERAVVLDRDGIIDRNDMLIEITSKEVGADMEMSTDHNLKTALGVFEKEYLTKQLSVHSHNVTRTAKAFQISRRNLQQKMNKYSLKLW